MLRLTACVLAVTLANAPALAQTAPATTEAALSQVSPAPPPEPPADSLASLVTGVVKGVSRLPSTETAWILGTTVGLSLAVHPRDAELTRRAVHSASLDSLFEYGAVGGSGFMQLGGAVVAYTIGRAAGSARVTAIGADLVRAQLLDTMLTQGLKPAVRRERPDGTPFSFPSGHASASFASATVLQQHLGWRVGVPAYVVASYIAASRLQENRHFASDVIFGAGIGIASARAIIVGRRKSALSVSPLIMPGGAGVGVTWLGSERKVSFGGGKSNPQPAD